MPQMKKVILIRSNQIQSDSRVEKYISFFENNGIHYEIIAWDRNDTGIELQNVRYYRRKVGYVVGGLKAAFNRLFWFKFVIGELRKIEKNDTIIHACDLDCAFPAVLYKIFFNKKVFILFDVFDWMSADIQANSNGIVRKSILWMEAKCLKWCNKLIVCEEERKSQIPEYEKYDISVLPNIPMIAEEETILQKKEEYTFNNDKITLSYVGWFGLGRFLDELLKLVEDGYFNLLIAGYGNKELEEKCSKLQSKGLIKYYGRVDYRTGLNIQYNADMVYAMYCKVTNNHIYAAPNKYYEAMFLGKPLLTTSGIIIGDKVTKLQTGYAVEENINDFINFINSLDRIDMKNRGVNARKLWEQEYVNYTRRFLENEYSKLLD